MILTKDQILAFKPKLKEVEVPELGGSVCIRVMSGYDRDIFNQLWDAPENKGKNVMPDLLVRSIVDAEGVRVFADDEKEKLVKTLDFRVLGRIGAEVMELNGMGKGAVEEASKG